MVFVTHRSHEQAAHHIAGRNGRTGFAAASQRLAAVEPELALHDLRLGRMALVAVLDEQRTDSRLEELDPAKARALANDLDKLIWAEGFSLPLTQSPGDVAVRSTLANFGAVGLADLNYTAIGFIRT